jgi:methylglutamate dehydrogenase subunit D
VADLFANLAPTDLVPAGHYGVAGTGVTVARVETAGIATIAASITGVRFTTRSGIELPDGPRYVGTAEVGFVGLGPGRWLAVGLADPERVLGEAFGAGTAICDQSDAYILFDVAGPAARTALAKGVAIDLDPAAFRPGDAATTAVALIGVTFWLVDAERFRFAVARSFAPGFLRFLVASAAEFGCAVA